MWVAPRRRHEMGLGWRSASWNGILDIPLPLKHSLRAWAGTCKPPVSEQARSSRPWQGRVGVALLDGMSMSSLPESSCMLAGAGAFGGDEKILSIGCMPYSSRSPPSGRTTPVLLRSGVRDSMVILMGKFNAPALLSKLIVSLRLGDVAAPGTRSHIVACPMLRSLVGRPRHGRRRLGKFGRKGVSGETTPGSNK